ncbi:MAG: oxidoreductase [Geminicoccus sp.]|nr:oxidoreductase [Geminicoccus sp.]
MRVALTGAGLRAGNVLSILKQAVPETEFVGYVDPSPSHLDMLGADIPRFDSVATMLGDTRPDLFFVGSPNAFHLEHLRAGLESDVPHIFTEKPVVISMAETMELARLLKAHDGVRRVMVGLVLRYSQHMLDLRQALAENVLGPITSLEANEHIGPYHGSFFMRDWRRHTALSGGFMLEKCCHDLDLYNMITGSRPLRVASFGGRRSFVPEHAEVSAQEQEILARKQSTWNAADDPFSADGDIVDFQTAILSYESGASLAFHTNINVPDEHRRFCIMGARGMAEGDFLRGFLKITRRDGSVYADKDYTSNDYDQRGSHYGADHMMIDDIVSFLRQEIRHLPVSITDALEAGVAALALDEARRAGSVMDLGETWSEFDQFGLRD